MKSSHHLEEDVGRTLPPFEGMRKSTKHRAKKGQKRVEVDDSPLVTMEVHDSFWM